MDVHAFTNSQSVYGFMKRTMAAQTKSRDRTVGTKLRDRAVGSRLCIGWGPSSGGE